MIRRRSIKLFDVFGIRVGVDGTWFVMLFLMIFLLSGAFRETLHGSDSVAYMTTVATVLLFFGSLIVHELSHALVARRLGIGVKRIELFLFGGITQMSREARTPAEEFKIAAAGPAGTLGVVLACLAIDLAIVGPHRLLEAAVLSAAIKITPVLLSLSWLLVINVLILVFNLVPAFPLDGGRIARAIVWRATGDRVRGTRTSAKLGEAFALLLGAVGIWMLLAAGSFGGLWLLALAFLLGQSARSALLQTQVSERIEGVRVADIMDRQPVAIPAETPVKQALDEYFHRYAAVWLPVVDDQGHFVGIARRERAEAMLDSGENWLTVGAALDSDDASSLRIDENGPLTELLSLESLGRLGAVMAVDREGVLRGIVTVEQVRRALQTVLGSPAAR
ncbi:MAG: site-2 protease family protein [Solirubrobacteraceae bacterium]